MRSGKKKKEKRGVVELVLLHAVRLLRYQWMM
jgi:hypothetical protein